MNKLWDKKLQELTSLGLAIIVLGAFISGLIVDFCAHLLSC